MMDRFRAAAGPDANLQTLSRGVNVVGLTSQSRDIIRLHATLFARHGITTIRNFDALNDVNNLVDSGRAIVDAGARHEVCVTMMSLPEGVTGAHDPDFYERTLRDILDAGIPYHSVCFKDASGTTTPAVVHETVKRARALLGGDAHIVFHSHDTAGVCVAQYLAALDAGANQIDLSLAPVSGGTCQVDVMTMYHALRGTGYTLGIDPAKVYEAEEVFKECMKDYFVPPEARAVEPLIPLSPMPGGALTANTQMLRDNGLMDRYEEIVRNMGECVMKGGFGTSVTPVSQFYFQQAFNNTMFGPWQKFADGYGKMVLGHFGRTPVPPDPEVVEAARVQLGLEPTTRLVADLNDEDPALGIEAAKRMLLENGITDVSEENIFIAATCLDKGIQFLKGEAKPNVRKVAPEPAAAPVVASDAVTVTVNGATYAVRFDGGRAVVNGRAYDVVVTGIADDAAAPATPAAAVVTAPMPGLVLRLTVREGDVVALHDELLVLEAMKMETRISATAAGTVRTVRVKQGDQVRLGDVLVEIGA